MSTQKLLRSVRAGEDFVDTIVFPDGYDLETLTVVSIDVNDPSNELNTGISITGQTVVIVLESAEVESVKSDKIVIEFMAEDANGHLRVPVLIDVSVSRF